MGNGEMGNGEVDRHRTTCTMLCTWCCAGVLRRQGSSQSDSSGFAESELTDSTDSTGSKVGLRADSIYNTAAKWH